MNIVLQTRERTLLSLSADELQLLTEVLGRVCAAGAQPGDADTGTDRARLSGLLGALATAPHAAGRAYESAVAWADQGSVMVRAITVFGDPVEFSDAEAADFVRQLQQALADAG